MSRVLHLIPVGISLLDAIDKKKVAAEVRTALQKTLNPAVLHNQAGFQAATESVRTAIRAATDATSGRLNFANLLPGVAGPLKGLRGRSELCAEWQSVKVEITGPPAGDPDEGHAYVLIATDTDAGLRAGAFVAAGFASDADVYYVDDPEPEFRSRVIEPGQAYLCRTPGLDLANPEKITEGTWRALGHIGHAIAETARRASRGRWRVVLHLSGGYKAMMPYLLILAEGINSVFKAPDRTIKGRKPALKAFVLHESADEHRVDCPVRALEGKLFANLLELKEAYDASVLNELRSSGLLGLCVDTDTGALTTAGVIMVQVP